MIVMKWGSIHFTKIFYVHTNLTKFFEIIEEDL